MKTPRQILFEKHHATLPALNQVRRNALNAIQTPRLAASLAFSPLRVVLTLWNELVVPARKTWTGVAAAWIFIFGFSLAMEMDAPKTPAHQAAYSPEIIMALRQQNLEFERLILSDTFAQTPEPAEPVRQTPQPRSSLNPAIAIG